MLVSTDEMSWAFCFDCGQALLLWVFRIRLCRVHAGQATSGLDFQVSGRVGLQVQLERSQYEACSFIVEGGFQSIKSIGDVTGGMLAGSESYGSMAME